MSHTQEVVINGRRLRLTNLDKVLYPSCGFTKGQVIDYYRSVSPVLLPHLKGRPLTLKRYPEGVRGFHFYEKHCPEHRPSWVRVAPVWSEVHGRDVPYCLAEDLATLVWAANLADLELHTSLSLARDLQRPTAMVFDLDPGAPADIIDCCRVALWLRALCEPLGLRGFPKTSGAKGLQIYVPLNTPVRYEETKPFAHAVARLLEQEHPDRVVSQMKKALRVGKVFVDWSQNDDHKTTVCVYSLRALERPMVSTPVEWDEVEEAARTGDRRLLAFAWDDALGRVARRGDLFASVRKLRQRLPELRAGAGARP